MKRIYRSDVLVRTAVMTNIDRVLFRHHCCLFRSQITSPAASGREFNPQEIKTPILLFALFIDGFFYRFDQIYR